MKEGYVILTDGRRFDIASKKVLELWRRNIVELVVPEGVENVYCYDNPMSKLILPEGVQIINCHNTLLTELVLPKSVIDMYCDIHILDGLDIHEDSDINIDIDL